MVDFGGGGPDMGSDQEARDRARGNQRAQRGVTADRSGGPGDRERKLPPQTLPSIAAAAAAPPPLEALRQAADIQNYLSDLQRIALGQSDSRAALDRFGVAPEQAMFDYRESFPEFGDSMSNLSLAEIIKNLGNMSQTPEPFAEGGRVGDERVRPRPDTTSDSVSTDLARFAQMLKDLMMMPSGAVDSQDSENPFGAPDKPRARRPIIPGGLIPSQTGSPRYGGDAEAFRFEKEFRDDSPTNIIPEGARPEIEVERLAPLVAPSTDSGGLTSIPNDISMPAVPSVPEMQLNEDIAEEIRRFEEMGSSQDRFYIDQYRRGSQDAERIAYYVLRSQGLSPQDAKNRVDGMTSDELGQMGSMGFKNGGETRRPFPGLLQENPQRTATVEEVIRDIMESRGLTQEEAVQELQARFRKTYPMSETVPDYSFAKGGNTQRPAPKRLQKQMDDLDRRIAAMTPEELDAIYEEYIAELDAYKLPPVPAVAASYDDYLRDKNDGDMSMFEPAKIRTVYAGGGQVRGRRDALPMVEGDHVVPAHAVKGNEGGLAALSKKLMGNKNYDGMIRGPGGPREDAIKTRVFAAGGGIAGKMDNLQNPFNSVPARVSDKEYVIPRQAITNLGMMNGAREGDANKAGQDIIYQLVENLKRKA